jgi:hypothetical protein
MGDDLGPFHGNEEGYARIYTVLAGVSAVAVLAIPWANILLFYRHRYGGQAGGYWANAVSATVISVVVAMTYAGVYRRLGRMIARGGPDAIELDRLRRQLATFAAGVYFLVLVVWWSGILSTRL